jgi:hypothetical protein
MQRFQIDSHKPVWAMIFEVIHIEDIVINKSIYLNLRKYDCVINLTTVVVQENRDPLDRDVITPVLRTYVETALRSCIPNLCIIVGLPPI